MKTKHVKNNYIEKRLLELEQKLYFCIRSKRLRRGIKLLKEFELSLRKNDYEDDVLISFLQISSRYYLSFNKRSSYIAVLFKLSYIYAEFSSFQSAYRTIDELLEIAKKRKRITLISKVYDLYLFTLLKENDINTAISISSFIRDRIGWNLIKKSTAHNMAVALLKAEFYEQAIEIFSEIENSTIPLSEINFSCRINLAICYRETGEHDRSISILEELDYYYMPDINSQIEFELVYAKSLISTGRFYDSISRVILAIESIEELLQDIYKIYYRRGVREYYVHRIEILIIKIPVSYFDKRVLNILCFTRQNQCSDWMHLLDWSDKIYFNPKIEEVDKADLKRKISSVASSGSPFKYGMHEKYDDHLDKTYNNDWLELGDTISNIRRKYGENSPFSLEKNKINSALHSNSLLISFLEVSNKIVLFNGDKFTESNLDRDTLIHFMESFYRYKSNEISNIYFANIINETIKSLEESMKEVINSLCQKCPEKLIYLTDKYELIPISSVFYRNDTLLRNLSNGSFYFQISPIIYCKDNNIPVLKNVVGISDESLTLSQEEILSFSSNINSDNLKLFNDQSKVSDFLKEIDSADVIHVTTHGDPIDYYSDPIHASLGSNHLINTHLIQSNFYRFNYSLCLLNSCHSSSNLQRRQISLTDRTLNNIKTYDTFSFPRIILTNRKSSCISSSWRTFDKYSYVLSLNVSKNISKGDCFGIALTKSIAKMILATESEIVGDIIPESDVNISKMGDISKLKNMFRHPYSYATYNFINTL
ncbi:tetratricopeptide repeat protein [Vibrio sp. MMH1-50]|uniref:tetratricopeptide repeat protein n=1 Tax=Vibrio sp. MMH1-50 TaxID=2917764 RepID=UPI001EF1CFE0|nr:tetratricopeptide repeat protein [Vibrio sp. MMH1-50]MCG7514374.1 tetratricopeptide repeat protein [Vibrio sp. MMH1-50]